MRNKRAKIVVVNGRLEIRPFSHQAEVEIVQKRNRLRSANSIESMSFCVLLSLVLKYHCMAAIVRSKRAICGRNMWSRRNGENCVVAAACYRQRNGKKYASLALGVNKRCLAEVATVLRRTFRKMKCVLKRRRSANRPHEVCGAESICSEGNGQRRCSCNRTAIGSSPRPHTQTTETHTGPTHFYPHFKATRMQRSFSEENKQKKKTRNAFVPRIAHHFAAR